MIYANENTFAHATFSYICTTHQSNLASRWEKSYHLHFTSCSLQNLLYQDLKLIKDWFHSQFKNTHQRGFCNCLMMFRLSLGFENSQQIFDLWLFCRVMTYFNRRIFCRDSANLQTIFACKIMTASLSSLSMSQRNLPSIRSLINFLRTIYKHFSSLDVAKTKPVMLQANINIQQTSKNICRNDGMCLWGELQSYDASFNMSFSHTETMITLHILYSEVY